MRIIILPGLDGTAQLLDDFSEELVGNDVEVVEYPSTLASYSEIVAFAQNYLPTDTKYVLVAESFSGPVAIQLAALKPAALMGIVFVATFARKPRFLPSVFASVLSVLPVKSHLLTWAAQPIQMGRWRNGAFTHKFRAALVNLPTSVLANRLKEVLRVDKTALLSTIEIPTIYLRPSQDWLVPASAGALFKNIQSLDGPHFILQAQPKESAERVSVFLKRIQQFSG